MTESTTKASQSKTIQGIVIAVVCTILGIIANAAGIDVDNATTKEIITQAVESIGASAVALLGLYLAWKGRYNPEIKPISKKE